MKTYTGDRTIDGVDVRVDGQPLPDRVDIHKFSSNGFEWTYEGEGPQQLALSLLADHLDDDQAALKLAEPFMMSVVANLANEWTITSDDIEAAVAALKSSSDT